MNENFILFDGAKVKNSNSNGKVTLYRNVFLEDSIIDKNVSIGDDTNVINCKLGKNIAINRRCYINDSFIGNYSYLGINTTVNYAKIGKFCSIARNVDIGGFNHDYKKISTLPEFRFKQLLNGGSKLIIKEQHDNLCQIGNDVWIAAGANILHNVVIGDGAIVGAGAVVTKDVEPYSIVAGVPAKIIKYRFEKKYIDELLKIKWWDWPVSIIENNIDLFIHSEMNELTIEKIKKIAREIEEREDKD